MSDSLRKDHLGCYGNNWIKTPNLDNLALDSVVFNSAYAEGLATIPVRIALFTGRYTLPYKGGGNLDKNIFLLAELLWNKGYTSALISDTYHMHEPEKNFGRGFDYVEWIRGQEYDPYITDLNIDTHIEKYSEKNERGKKFGVFSFEQYLRNVSSWKGEEDHFIAQVVKAGISWLEKKISGGKNDDLFLWLDCYDPHEPSDPPSFYKDMYPVPEYNGLPIICPPVGDASFLNLDELRHFRAQYAGEVSLVDKWIGVFLNKLDDLGLWENTLLLFLADHGQPLGEHGMLRKGSAWPYEELSHIPLILKFPDKNRLKNTFIDSFVGMPDILPTILDFLNLKIPKEIQKAIQGKSLISIIQGEENHFPFGISGHYDLSIGLRKEGYSFYHWWKPSPIIQNYKQNELYKLDKNFFPPEPAKYEPNRDLAEIGNIISEKPELANNFMLDIKHFINTLTKK
jgi:arylsulfatase A-like enzyme